MRNKKIESILAQQDEIRKEFGAESEELRAFYNTLSNGAWAMITAYRKSNEKGFDEIVFTRDDIIWENEVEEIIAFCKEAKIGWFVYGSGYSGAMGTVMALVNAGARVGAFVIKECKIEMFGNEEIVKVPGFRINL